MPEIKISIITAALNSSATISTCLNSIKSQSVAVEHIIKDGGSTDGTLDIIKQQSPDAIIISEPDIRYLRRFE
jgi:glycosyltransferase